MLMPGSVVYVPRLDKMICYRLYWEQEVSEAGAASPGYVSMPAPYAGTPYPM